MKYNKKFVVVLVSAFALLGLGTSSVVAQSRLVRDEELSSLDYTKKMVKKLTGPFYWGRGYTNDGMKKASLFIADQLQKMGVPSFQEGNYFQEYTHPVNTFPGEVQVIINGRLLIPGVDYILSPGSKGLVATGTLSPSVTAPDEFEDPTRSLNVSFEEKLTFSVSRREPVQTSIILDQALFTEIPKEYDIEIQNEFVPEFKAQNIIGVVRGTVEPEKYFVLSAHYDHLGGMGTDTYFPGANDNASGTSFLLSLARYYATHPQKYSLVFMFFGSEEAGLIGSKYYVNNPLFPLNQIRFLTNFDMVGTGVEGFTVVNATEYPNEFQSLTDTNSKGKYFVDIGARGKAANSDHYWFTENGVPAFFIYTRGGIRAYHDVFDKAETLPLDHVDALRELIIQFYSQMMGP